MTKLLAGREGIIDCADLTVQLELSSTSSEDFGELAVNCFISVDERDQPKICQPVENAIISFAVVL